MMKVPQLVVGAVLVLCCAALGCERKESTQQRQTAVVESPTPGVLPPPTDLESAPADATVTDSGLACVVLREGTGSEHPQIYDTVEMHQVVWSKDGTMQMNTGDRGAPVEFEVTQSVLPGLREAIELMVEGEKRRCWIPGRLAFGEPGASPATDGKPRGMLVYELDLVSLKKAAGLPKAPPDVAAVPEDAEKSDSGLAWKVLEEGSGDATPAPTSVVALYYTGWTPDGEVFMTTRDNLPKSSAMQMMIPGWREGLSMMRVGEKRRFWVPPELAYRGQPGRPQTMVVLDIELLAVTP